MPVPSCLLANSYGSPQLGQNGFECRDDRVKSFRLGAHRQQGLLEVEIERQRSSEMKRELVFRFFGQALRSFSKGHDFGMQFNCVRYLFIAWAAGVVMEIKNLPTQKGPLLIDFQNFEAFPALRDYVHLSVGMLLGYSHNLCGAPDIGHAVVVRAQNSEAFFLFQTLSDHFFVSRLKNVQWQGSTREKNQVQRKQGQKRLQLRSSRGRRDELTDCTPRLDFVSARDYKHVMEITGKVVVVTGASMGIGEALARAFVDRDARVVLLSRDGSRAEAARGRIGHADRTLALPCDVRHREDIDRVLSLTLHHFGRIDIWINNAGHGLDDSIATMDMAACRETFETNLFGAIDAMQAVIPLMKQQGSGTIINVSSVAGHIAVPYKAVYSATKFAMNAMGAAARVELKVSGIHVITLCPGYVRTAFGENALKGEQAKNIRPSGQRGISAERVARAAVRAYVKEKREVVVPWTMHPAIKIYQLFPALVEKAMLRMARSR